MTLISERFYFDGSRQVTAYVPARNPEIIVYCGDGQLIAPWGADLEAKGLPPTIIVGVHHNADETLRLHEYSPKFDPVRFERHETFLVGEVRSWAEKRLGGTLPRERTAIFGVSASGELALALGVRHPDVFGGIFSASPGAGYRPEEEIVKSMPPTYLLAGKQEPFFLDNAVRWAAALRRNGRDVVMEERDAGHDDTMWRAEFPEMISWFSSGRE